MTRINTNVSSLNAQKTLARSNAQLQESLTRLSTGLRINSGKDDPAGLIASETLRSDITATERAITNSQRANQLIATADSALGQVSSLLNDIRGLVSEAANSGAVSAEQIAANQLQVDSSLEAVDRIAQVTQFQGRRLLDGSLDFITEGVDNTKISNLAIDQANFGTQSEIAVAVDVVAQAEKAQLTYGSNHVNESVVLQVGGSSGFEAFNFAAGSTVAEMAAAINLVSDAVGVSATVISATAAADTTGALTLNSVGANNDIVLTAVAAGADAGDIAVSYVAGAALGVAYTHNATGTDTMVVTVKDGFESSVTGAAIGATTADFDAVNVGSQYNDLTISITQGGTESVSYDVDTNTFNVVADVAGGTDTVDELVTLMGTTFSDLFTISNIALGTAAITATDYTIATAGGVDSGTITSTAGDVVDAINADATAPTYLSAALATGDSGVTAVTLFTEVAYYGSANTGSDYDKNDYLQFLGPDDSSNLTFTFANGGASQSLSVTVDGDTVTVNLATDADSQVTTTATALIAAINGSVDLNALGISVSGAGTSDGSGLVSTGTLTFADVDADGLAMLGAADEGDDLGAVAMTFNSTDYGSKEFVSVKAVGDFETVNADDEATERDTGADVNARINGIQTVSDGLNVSINTSSLDVSFTLAASVAVGSNTSFTITEGGAQFQLGPDVVSNQQARLGVRSVNTSTLGGASGQLFQLRSGGTYSLANDTSTAARIVEEAIVSVTTLRGRLGAFQKTTLETNINALSDTLESLTDAESSIRDADFAAESANLTRAQILVQSGTSVLAMANQNPQNVLALLR